MRFKISLSRTGKQRMLPMDYQYYLSAWIYTVFSKADREFASFLHTSGYTAGGKRFKLFNYSPINFGRPVLWKENGLFEIDSAQLSLKVSFHLVEAAGKFIIGLFNDQQLYVGDQFNGLDLTVKQVERLPEPVLTDTTHYRAVSPVVISCKEERSKYARYLAPTDYHYDRLLWQNLLNKQGSIPGTLSSPDLLDFEFKLNSTPKSKLVTIKPHTPAQSRVRGFLFDFTLTCPVELQRFILATGIGEKNSTGFGWVEVV